MMLHVLLLSQRLSIQEVPPLLNGDSSSRSQQQQRPSQSDILSQSLIGLSPSNTSQHNGNAHSSSSTSLTHSQPAVSVAGLQSSLSVSHTSTSSHGSLQGLTPPLTAPHSPPLPHSAPMSRALTPVLSTAHHAVSSSPTALNVLKGPDLYATSTLPLPRRQASDARMGFLGAFDFVFAIFETCSGHISAEKAKDKNSIQVFS